MDPPRIFTESLTPRPELEKQPGSTPFFVIRRTTFASHRGLTSDVALLLTCAKREEVAFRSPSLS
jgi:hypothetical protein